MSRYFGDISPKYRVSKGIDTIFLAEISARQFFRINLEKSAIYRDISAILARNRRFSSVKVKCATVSATVHLHKQFASEGI